MVDGCGTCEIRVGNAGLQKVDECIDCATLCAT